MKKTRVLALLCSVTLLAAPMNALAQTTENSNEGVGTYILPDPVPADMRALVNRIRDEVASTNAQQVRHGELLTEFGRGEPLQVVVTIGDEEQSIEQYMDAHALAGLIVVKDGEVLAEHYRFGNKESSRTVIQSVTKSFVSTVLGAAIKDGFIASLDDSVAKYVPELEGTPYGATAIRDVADMVSGVSPIDADHSAKKAYPSTDPAALMSALGAYTRTAEPGEKYFYDDINYLVVSRVVENAVGMPIQDYISQEIWAPVGMKYDGYMRSTALGLVDGHGGLSMTLGDMARFGQAILDTMKGEGPLDVPEGWFEEISSASTSSDGIRAPGKIDEAAPDFGYQLGWWTLPRGREAYELGEDGAFTGLGWGGNALYVVPSQNVVIAYQNVSTYHDGALFFDGKLLATAIVEKLREPN